MEFSKKDMKILQGVAILFMLALHLFARKEINGLYEIFPEINGVPLVYYLALFGDACVPIYLFVSGYGLYVSLRKEKGSVIKKNIYRILKLLINFWIILFTFMIVAFFLGKYSEAFSGGITSFLLNFLLFSNSFNGAWWYVQTYVILIILTPFLMKTVKNHSTLLVFFVAGVIYFFSYLQRIKQFIDIGDNFMLVTIVNAIVLVGTSQFAFVVGMIFAKDHIYTKLHKQFYQVRFKNLACMLGIFLLVFIHALYESMIIAPITGILFICLFNLMNKSNWLQKALLYMGDHSTNIWLIHMFFYMSLFPNLIFAPKYPLLIFLNLVFFSLLSSYVINTMYKPIVKVIDKKQRKIENSFKDRVYNPLKTDSAKL